MASKRTGKLSVVGHCLTCGAPIYGKSRVAPGESAEVQRSCMCIVPLFQAQPFIYPVYPQPVLPAPAPYVPPYQPFPTNPTWPTITCGTSSVSSNMEGMAVWPLNLTVS